MFFVPYEKVVYETALTAADIERTLLIVTEPTRIRLAFLEGKSPNTFEGEVDNCSFVIRRIKYSNNIFNPVARGKIVERSSHNEIVVILLPTIITTLWLLGWIGMLIFITIMDIMRAIDHHINLDLISIPLLIPYAIILIGFKMDSKKMKDALQSTLQLK